MIFISVKGSMFYEITFYKSMCLIKRVTAAQLQSGN